MRAEGEAGTVPGSQQPLVTSISLISVAGKRRNRWDETSVLLVQSVVGRVRLSKLLVFFVVLCCTIV